MRRRGASLVLLLAAVLGGAACLPGEAPPPTPTPTPTPTATPTPTPTPTRTPTPTPILRLRLPTPTPTPTPRPYVPPPPYVPPTPWSPPGYYPPPGSGGDVIESCSGSFKLPASYGFKVTVECASWGSRTLFTIKVKTDYFADFDYPINVKVEVDPPNAPSGSDRGYLYYDGDSVEFDWPPDFLFTRDTVTGRYDITVKAQNFGGYGWVTIAAGSFTIR